MTTSAFDSTELDLGESTVEGSPPADRRRWLIVAAIVLTGLTMRVAVTSVGAVLTDLERGLHASSSAAGIITTLPVIAFAGIGFLGPRLAHRFGEHRLVAAALLATTAGLVLRAVAGSVWMFAVLSMLALTGGAIANVLLPALVKRHFPDRIGTMTAVYTTSLALGLTASAGFTAPLAELGGQSWRFGIGAWALLSAVAVLPWLPMLAGDRPDPASQPDRVPLSWLLRSKLAWALVLMFGTQSFQAYIAFGWFTDFFRHHNLDATEAGLLLAFYAALSIPVSMAIPALAVRGQRLIVVVLSAAGLISYLGMLTAPVAGAWLWMLLGGISGGMFPLALTMIGLRSRQIATTAALSAFVQGIGYLLAGAGPLLVGVLLGVSDSWTWPLVLLILAVLGSAATGWYAARPDFVDDQLSRPAGRLAQ
ncbi:MAG TPA: MFS transporter [Jatrophihabitans sp.]|uniref:CynX/NimT family MFS transporter n=1 Tax=Jatrophihabitans sp. TaxID=1932789 RepID=UPI002F20DFA6